MIRQTSRWTTTGKNTRLVRDLTPKGSSGSGSVNITGAVPCKITGGSSVSGYTVAVYGNGIMSPVTGGGMLYILEISGVAQLETGSVVLGWPSLTVQTGGNELP